MPGHVKGQPTSPQQKAANARLRARWAREGLCNRCGGDKEGVRFKRCRHCRMDQAPRYRDRYLQVRQAARTLGLTVRQARQRADGASSAVLPESTAQ
jgi:hypothetical protein